MDSQVEVNPLTPDRWADAETLFGERGACAGCWCMWWRLHPKQWDAMRGEANRQLFRAIVESGEAPGLLAYVDGKPAGWCALAPREAYSRLQGPRLRVLKPVDDLPVWSVTCFFVAKPYRRKGVTRKLLEAAVEFARERGATIVEGYPTEPGEKSAADAFVYTGLASTFRSVGFVEVARRSETRPIMRYFLE